MEEEERSWKEFPLWKDAVQRIVDMDPEPGYVITEEWMLEHFGFQPPIRGTREDFEKFQLLLMKTRCDFARTLLYDHQIVLKADRKRNYEVCGADEALDLADDIQYQKVHKTLRKAMELRLNMDEARMDMAQSRRNTEEINKLGMLRGIVSRAKKATSVESLKKLMAG